LNLDVQSISLKKVILEKSRLAITQEPKLKKRINKVAQRYERMLETTEGLEQENLNLLHTNLAKVNKEVRLYERVHSEDKRTTKYLIP
jgi:hypothetical protein